MKETDGNYAKGEQSERGCGKTATLKPKKVGSFRPRDKPNPIPGHPTRPNGYSPRQTALGCDFALCRS